MKNGSDDPLVNKEISGSKLLERLVQGPFATVYLAEHPEYGQTQLCILSEEISHEDEALTRYFDDLNKVATLNHPHVRRVYRCGVENDVAFVELEHFNAQTLNSILKGKGRFPLPEAMILFNDMRAGLKEAHQLGLVKRSLSLDSFLLLEDGTLKIHDFGQLADNLGVPAYMSPEQCAGETIEQRSDIYSLGAVVYHLITGHPMFSGETVIEIMQKHLQEMPLAPHRVRPEVPLALSQLIMDMLKKKAKDRPQSIDDIEERMVKIAYRESPEFLEDLNKGFSGPFEITEILEDRGASLRCRGKAKTENEEKKNDGETDSLIDLTLIMKEAPSEIRESLERSLKLLKPISHPRIGSTLQYVNEGDMGYCVTELIETRLSYLLQSGMILDEERALKIVRQSAEALDVLHKAGLRHGDLTPAAIGLTEDDSVKLTDFGALRVIEGEGARPGAIVGTPHYMAPEVCAALPQWPVSANADIYSLGVVFFEMVNGQRPFQGQSVPEIFLKHMEEPAPPANRANADLSKGSVHLIANMMAKRPEHRYQSVEELLKDLDEVLARRPIEKREKLDVPIRMGGGCLGSILLMVSLALSASFLFSLSL